MNPTMTVRFFGSARSLRDLGAALPWQLRPSGLRKPRKIIWDQVLSTAIANLVFIMKLLELLIQLPLIPSGKGHFPGAARTPQRCFSCWVLGVWSRWIPALPQVWGETTPTSLNCFQHQNPRVFPFGSSRDTKPQLCTEWGSVFGTICGFLSQSSFKLFAPGQETAQTPRAGWQIYFHGLLYPHPFP